MIILGFFLLDPCRPQLFSRVRSTSHREPRFRKSSRWEHLNYDSTARHLPDRQQQIVCAKAGSVKHDFEDDVGVCFHTNRPTPNSHRTIARSSWKAERSRGSSINLTCNECCTLKLQHAMTRSTACVLFPIFWSSRSRLCMERPPNRITSFLRPIAWLEFAYSQFILTAKKYFDTKEGFKMWGNLTCRTGEKLKVRVCAQ